MEETMIGSSPRVQGERLGSGTSKRISGSSPRVQGEHWMRVKGDPATGSSPRVQGERMIRNRTEDLCFAVESTPWARDEFAFAIEHRDSPDPVEQARRFLVRSWQAIGVRHGSPSWTGGWRFSTKQSTHNPTVTWTTMPSRIRVAADRLRHVQIENRPALDVISRHSSPDCLIYADLPYVRSARSNRARLYTHEMTDLNHIDLLNALEFHPGPVVLSGYPSALYDSRLEHWHRISMDGQSQVRGAITHEVLWINAVAKRQLNFGLF
jgi:DNA adenine methylase